MKKFISMLFLLILILSKSLPFIYRAYNPDTKKIETFEMLYQQFEFVIPIKFSDYILRYSWEYLRNEDELLFVTNMWKLNRLILSYTNQNRMARRKNMKIPKWIKKFENILCKYKWYRKWYGGIWELWWVDCVNTLIWHNKNLRHWYGRPTPICRGKAIKIEDYTSILYYHLYGEKYEQRFRKSNKGER